MLVLFGFAYLGTVPLGARLAVYAVSRTLGFFYWLGSAYPTNIHELSARIDQMQSTPGVNQVATKKRNRPFKDQLKKTKQCMKWADARVEYVVFEDVLKTVQRDAPG